jgi:hypothetical protein
MATIQLGDGKRYENSRVVVGGRVSRHMEPASALVIKCMTPKGKDQKHFPVRLTLSRDELLELVSNICTELLTPVPVEPPPRKRVVF